MELELPDAVAVEFPDGVGVGAAVVVAVDVAVVFEPEEPGVGVGEPAGGAVAVLVELFVEYPPLDSEPLDVFPDFCSSSQLWYSSWETTRTLPSIAEWPTPQYSAQ